MTGKISKSRNLILIICILIASVLIISLAFGELFFSPSRYLYSDAGDGIKNYYTPAYYVKYDSGTTFSGMNYPYGTHLVCTDGQLLLSAIIRYFNIGHDNPGKIVIGIVNFLMFSSLVLTAVFVFLLLRKLKLPYWYSAPVSLILTFLSPQLARIVCHYALAYPFFIPCLWYFTIKLTETRKAIYALLITVVITLMGLLHPYYNGLGAVFILVYWFVYYLSERKTFATDRFLYLKGILSGVLPMIFFQVFMKLTDSAKDRPDPWGFFHYKIRWEGIFLPSRGPILNALDYLIPIRRVDFETMAYIGIPATLAVIFTIIKIVAHYRKGQKGRLKNPVLPQMLKLTLPVSVIVFLIGMSLPFSLGLEFLLDMLKPLKQFRALGRFAWIFYYLITVYAAYYIFLLYRYFRLKTTAGLANTFVILMMFIWGWESLIYVREIGTQAWNGKSTNIFDENNNSYRKKFAGEGIDLSGFQALVALPFFNLGSEKVDNEKGGNILTPSLTASYQLGLPLVNGWMARSSRSVSENVMQFAGNEIIPKTIIGDLPSEKDFLLMVYNENLTENELSLLKKATFLTEKDKISFYKLPVDSLRPTNKYSEKFNQEKSSLIGFDGYYAKNRPSLLYYNGYEDIESDFVIGGKGAFFNDDSLKGEVTIFEETGIFPEDSVEVEASVWVYLDKKLPYVQSLYFKMGELPAEELAPARNNYSICKSWIRAGKKIWWKRGDKLRIYLRDSYFTIDELLVKPVKAEIYTNVSDKAVFFNNYPVILNSVAFR